MGEAYLSVYYSDENVRAMQEAVMRTGGFSPAARPSLATVKAGMGRAYYQYARPDHTGTAAMLDRDFGHENDPAVQYRRLEKLNGDALLFIVEAVDVEAKAEALYNYELATPLGDRMPQYPTVSSVHKTVSGTVRFLEESQAPSTVALAKALAANPAYLNYLNVTENIPEVRAAGWSM